MLYIGLHSDKHEKIWAETIRPRVLIIDMKHHLVDLYQLCSNYAPWAKNGPAPGWHMLYIGLHTEKHEKIFLCETNRPRVLIIVI